MIRFANMRGCISASRDGRSRRFELDSARYIEAHGFRKSITRLVGRRAVRRSAHRREQRELSAVELGLLDRLRGDFLSLVRFQIIRGAWDGVFDPGRQPIRRPKPDQTALSLLEKRLREIEAAGERDGRCRDHPRRNEYAALSN